jgi:hypothetical protein
VLIVFAFDGDSTITTFIRFVSLSGPERRRPARTRDMVSPRSGQNWARKMVERGPPVKWR